MELTVEQVDVWAATIEDTPGTLAHVLTGLKEVGADLSFVIARRSHVKPGASIVFVTPLRGDAEIQAAESLGFNVSSSMHSIRVVGPNTPGTASQITTRLANAAINLRGFSAAVLGSQFVVNIALDTAQDANKAVDVLNRVFHKT